MEETAKTCRNPRCGKQSPAEAQHCTHCGLLLSGKVTRLWDSDILAIVDGADFTPLIEAIWEPEWLQPDRPRSVSADLIRWAFSAFLTERQQQVMIRRFGLDGQGRRSVRQIKDEAKVSSTSVRTYITSSLMKLRYLRTRLVLSGKEPKPKKS